MSPDNFNQHRLAWLSYKERTQGCAVNTVAKYAKALQRLGEHFGLLGIDPLTINAEQLEKFAGLELHKLGIGPRARRPMVSAFRGFYAWLFKADLIHSNPAEQLPLPNYGAPLPVSLSLGNAERLIMAPGLDTFAGVRDTALFSVMLGTGARVGGLAGLNESALRWLNFDGRERLAIELTEKGSKSRLLPVPEEARLLVRAYLGHPELSAIDRTLSDGDRVLWCSINNRQISPDNYHGEARRLTARSIDKMIKRHGAAAGIPLDQLHVHAARHLVGIEMEEDGVNILTMQAILGHSDPKSTQIYSRMAPGKLAKITDQSSPLAKINTPVTELAKQLQRSKSGRAPFAVV